MRPQYPTYPPWPPVAPYYPPHNHSEGALPLILISVFGIATAANGISIILGVSFIFCLVATAALYGFKLYLLLHRQHRIERTPGSQRDKVFIYLILTIILLTLMSFGLYGYGYTEPGAKNKNILAPATSSQPERDSFAPPTITTQPKEQNYHERLFSFFSATGEKETYALICWIVAGVIEGITLIFGLRDRRSDYYYWD